VRVWQSAHLPPDLERWLNLEQAARELHIHPQSLRRLIKGDRFTGARRFGSSWLIDPDALAAFKETYDPTPGPTPIRRLL
jgi:hypothetical protein